MPPFATPSRAIVGDLEIAYRRAGGGTPVLLVHGIPSSSRLWDAVGADLATDFDVIAPDLVGFGDSEKPLDRDVSITAQAAWLSELLDRLGIDRAAVIGHDIGGGVAQVMATRHPDRVAALGLIDSVCFDSWPIPAMRAIAASAPVVERLPAGWVTSALEPVMGREVPDGEPREALAAAIGAWGEDTDGIRAFLGNVQALDSRHTEEIAPLLGRIEVPTHIVWGADDPHQQPKWAARLRDAIPGASLKLLDAGHFVPWERPAEVAAEVRGLLRQVA